MSKERSLSRNNTAAFRDGDGLAPRCNRRRHGIRYNGQMTREITARRSLALPRGSWGANFGPRLDCQAHAFSLPPTQ